MKLAYFRAQNSANFFRGEGDEGERGTRHVGGGGGGAGVSSGDNGSEDELEEEGGLGVPVGFLQGDYSEPSASEE